MTEPTQAPKAPMLLLGAGASRAFGIPTMPEFLSETWRDLDQRSVAAALAVRRSLELHELVDFEEVMFLLEELAAMRREDAIAAPFLPRFTTKDSAVQRVLDFDKVQKEAMTERETLRRLIYDKCNAYDRAKAWEVYPKLIRALQEVTGAERIYVATTNYDRVIESLWGRDDGMHSLKPSFDLQTGFFAPPYGARYLDVKRGYPEKSTEHECVVHLVKVHGSLDWRRYDSGRIEETGAREYPAEAAVLAYPIRRDKSKDPPFSELYEAFDDALARADFIVVIGLSLRDEAIVNRLADALSNGRKLCVIVDPKAELVRNRLPQDVRKVVGLVEKRFVEELSLGTEEEWREVIRAAAARESSSQKTAT